MLQPGVALTEFRAASEAFLATVREIRDWDAPSGIGEWTVRELAGHTLRAYSTIETYLAAEPRRQPTIDGPTQYYRVGLSAPGTHEGVAARGREAGAALTEPVAQAEATAARVLALVESLPTDTVVHLLLGQMALGDYLDTRTIEVTIHTLDLRRAVGLSLDAPEAAVQLCLDVLLPLAHPVTLLLGITGRGTVNVLG